METIKTLAIFFIAYECMKILMPKVELSWRMYNWQLKQSKIAKATMTEGPDGKLEIKMQPRPERPMTPNGMWLYFAINFVYTIWLFVAFFTFNVVFMITSLLFLIWSNFIQKRKPSIPIMLLDGVVSVGMLLPFVLL